MRLTGFRVSGKAHGQASRRGNITRSFAALCLLATLWLSSCALPGAGTTGSTQVTPPTPPATATPVLWLGAPHELPTGWKIYHTTHFSLALPTDWWVRKVVLPDSTPAHPHITYGLYSPQDWLHGAVEEWDGLAPAQISDKFCAPTADYTVRTVAGLSMRFSTGLGAMDTGSYSPFERDWTFISDHGTVYELWVDDGPNSDADHHIELNHAVVDTFAPQYSAWGCA